MTEVLVESFDSETAGRRSHRSLFASTTSLTSGMATSSSANTSLRTAFPAYIVATPPGAGDRCPSPTIMSMEALPLETDAVALPDFGMMFVSGSIPSFSSLSSAVFYLVSAGPPTTVIRRARLRLARGPMPVWSARPLGRENISHTQSAVCLKSHTLPRSRSFSPCKKWVLRTLVYCKKIGGPLQPAIALSTRLTEENPEPRRPAFIRVTNCLVCNFLGH